MNKGDFDRIIAEMRLNLDLRKDELLKWLSSHKTRQLSIFEAIQSSNYKIYIKYIEDLQNEINRLIAIFE